MELSLISTISLLTVCLAALLIRKKTINNAGSGILSLLGARMRRIRRTGLTFAATLAGLAVSASPTFAQSDSGGEASLILPDLSDVTFFGGINGHNLLLVGLVVCMLGLLFGLAIYMNLKKLPVHRAMREISELIYETCKTYLITQGKFILIL